MILNLLHGIAYLRLGGVCWLERKRENVGFIHPPKSFLNNSYEVQRSLHIVIPRCLCAVNENCVVIMADSLKKSFHERQIHTRKIKSTWRFTYVTMKAVPRNSCKR